MDKDELATVDVFRFDPEIDSEPSYVEFKVPYKGRTILDVLRYIYENVDSTVAFRWSCGAMFCRCCIIAVNGKPALACMEPAKKHMKIEPHPKFTVIKDLICDLNQPK